MRKPHMLHVFHSNWYLKEIHYTAEGNGKNPDNTSSKPHYD